MAATMKQRFRRQVRGFAILWTCLSIGLAAAAFIAVYSTYGTANPPPADDLLNAALPLTTGTAVAQAATATPNPTPPPTTAPTTPPTAEVTAQAAAAEPTALPATPTLLPINDRRFHLGVQVQVSYDIMDTWMNVAANQLSVRWVKQQIRWEDMEPTDDVFEWFYTDTYLESTDEFGLNVLASIVTAPDWAREPGVNLDRHGPPADPAEYAEFLRELLTRYPGRIQAIEVWNEQNLDREWTSASGRLAAAEYIELLRVAYQTIKDIDPGIIVISGALSPTGVSDGVTAVDDFQYMDEMIAAGLLNYSDCIGAHHNGINVSPAYTWDATPNDPTAQFRGPFDNPHHSWSFRSTLQTYANKIAVAGGDQPLCVTEFGWASAEGIGQVRQGFEFASDNTLEEQRDFTVLAIESMREWDTVWIAILWNLNYGPQSGFDPNNDNVFYSIIGPSSQFRPVFDAVRDWNRAYEAELSAGS